MGLTVTLVLLYSISLCNSDFFSDLEELDLESKFRELNNVINSLTKDDDKMPKKYGDSSNTDDTVEDLVSLFGGECVYKCKNGEIPQKRADHLPSANGCGPSGIFEMDIPYLSGMTMCCNNHDFCYDTCSQSRATCDTKFQKCLLKICKNIPKSVSKTISKNDCKKVADVLYSGTVALGCSFYLDAQEKACTCDTKIDQITDTKFSKAKAMDDQYKLSYKNKENNQSKNSKHTRKIEL